MAPKAPPRRAAPALEHPARGHGHHRSPPSPGLQPRTTRSLDPVLLPPFPRPARADRVGTGRQGYAQDLPSEIEKMRYDLCAIARPSLLRDLWVLLATAKTVLVGHPALKRRGGSDSEKPDRNDAVAFPFGELPVFSLRALARRPMPALTSRPDESMVGVYWKILHGFGPSQGLPDCSLQSSVLSIAAETLRPIAQTWIDTQPESHPASNSDGNSPYRTDAAGRRGGHTGIRSSVARCRSSSGKGCRTAVRNF